MSEVPRINPSPDGTGFDLFEHWEYQNNQWSLLAVSSTPSDFDVMDGDCDLVVRRRWAPAGEPVLYKRKI